MAITVSGSSLVFTGTVNISNFSNPSAGVVTLTLTPSGGVGTLPALVAGTPGLPPLINSFTVNQVSSSTPASGSLTQTNAGGPGLASQYSMTLNLPQGATGTAGTSGALHSVSDATGTVAAGVIPVATSSTAFAWTLLPGCNVYNATSINSLSEVGAVTGLLCSVSIPAQPYNWYPVCFASCVVTGTTATVVNLQALLNNASSGQQCGVAYGVAGVPNQSLTMIPGFGGLVNGTSTYGVVNAGATATIYFNATETAGTGASWSTSNTTTSCTVAAVPTLAA